MEMEKTYFNKRRKKEAKDYDIILITYLFLFCLIVKYIAISIIPNISTIRVAKTLENEGFNMQKNGTFDIRHLYSKDSTAIKVHYLMIPIAHIIRQLLEKGKKGIKELRLKKKR